MNREQVVTKMKALNLPKDSYVVFGAAPLAIAGIREAQDIDLVVSKQLLEELRKSGWQEFNKGPNDVPIVYDIFEAHDNWNFGSYNPTLEHLLGTATVVDGIPFASIEEVRKWKIASDRPKDAADVELIDKYFKKNK